jgi:UDP-3-O-[3-hydroxymyristoyl] glucosamine N-acyltransferase
MKLSRIAELINGEMTGNDTEISGISDLDSQKENTIAFADNKKHLELLSQTAVAALIVPSDLDCPLKPSIRVADPKLAFTKVLSLFSPYKPYQKKIYPNVYIEESAKIGKNVTILPFTNIMDHAEIGDETVIYSQVYIGKNVKIGKNCVIESGVKIDDESVIGDAVVIHHNSVIGGDGFGFIQKDGRNIKLPQIGKIVIEDEVEIGACVTIDRATMGETRISKGVIIDNLVQIAHNVKIGENSIIISQTGISGSSTIGKNCILTGQVGISDHVHIGDNVVILAKSGVEDRHVESGRVIFGYPARDVMEQKRIFASLPKLPELIKTVRELQKKLEAK